MRLALLVTLLLARFAFADWWNVGPGPAPPPVSNPKCVANCDDAPSSPQQQQRSNPNRRDPQEEARQRAAAEAARREAERRAQEAQRDYESVRDATTRLRDVGSLVREQAHRFEDYREQLEQRETKVRSLERALAPVRASAVEKPPPGARTPLSMKEYCDRLNAAAAPARSLRASEVPLPSAQVAARTAAMKAPPVVPPGRFGKVLEEASDALKEKAKEAAEARAWEYLDSKVPILKSARETFESAKANYEALTEMTTRLATSLFIHAGDVAHTVSGSGGTATDEDNDRVIQSMGRDVTDTSSTRLSEEAPELFGNAGGWFSPGEEP